MGDTLTPQNQPRGHTIATLRAALDDLERTHGCDDADMIVIRSDESGGISRVTRIELRDSHLRGVRAVLLSA